MEKLYQLFSSIRLVAFCLLLSVFCLLHPVRSVAQEEVSCDKIYISLSSQPAPCNGAGIIILTVTGSDAPNLHWEGQAMQCRLMYDDDGTWGPWLTWPIWNNDAANPHIRYYPNAQPGN